MSPELEQVHIGDLFYLHCWPRGDSSDPVMWFHNDKALQTSSDELKIEFAASEHSGTYHCEIGGSSGNTLFISVLSKLNPPSHSALTSQKNEGIHAMLLFYVIQTTSQELPSPCRPASQ